MAKIYKKAVILELPYTILKGLGRGVEVKSTTSAVANMLLSKIKTPSEEPYKIYDTYTSNIKYPSLLSPINKVSLKTELNFTMGLKDNEEYSEILFITNTNEVFIITPL